MKTTELHNYLERIGSLLRRDTRASGMELGLQPVQLEALHYLASCNHYSDTPLAVTEYLGITKGTVSQSLKVLENKGLIRKITDKGDKRVVHLKITTAGKRVLEKAIPAKVLLGAAELLPEKELETLNVHLKDLLLSAQKANAMKSFGLCRSCRFNQLSSKGYFCGLTEEPLKPRDVTLICREHEYPEGVINGVLNFDNPT